MRFCVSNYSHAFISHQHLHCLHPPPERRQNEHLHASGSKNTLATSYCLLKKVATHYDDYRIADGSIDLCVVSRSEKVSEIERLRACTSFHTWALNCSFAHVCDRGRADMRTCTSQVLRFSLSSGVSLDIIVTDSLICTWIYLTVRPFFVLRVIHI